MLATISVGAGYGSAQAMHEKSAEQLAGGIGKGIAEWNKRSQKEAKLEMKPPQY